MVEEQIGSQVVFNQPAGHVDPGESIVAAVKREVLEETAYVFTPEALIGVYELTAGSEQRQYVRFCFSGPAHGPVPDRELDTEILRACWISREDLVKLTPRLRSHLVLACIDDYESGRRHPLDLIHASDV